jgi:hypothetical protein
MDQVAIREAAEAAAPIFDKMGWMPKRHQDDNPVDVLVNAFTALVGFLDEDPKATSARMMHLAVYRESDKSIRLAVDSTVGWDNSGWRQ